MPVDAGAVHGQYRVDSSKPLDSKAVPGVEVDILIDTEKDRRRIRATGSGVQPQSCLSVCYAAVVPGSTKPAGYSFLAELADTSAEQISIEAAQPRLDLGVLKHLSSKKIMLGVLDLGNPEIETAEIVADRIRNGLKYVAADRLIPAPDCGMKYMPRHIAFGKLKAMCDAAAIVRQEIS